MSDNGLRGLHSETLSAAEMVQSAYLFPKNIQLKGNLIRV